MSGHCVEVDSELVGASVQSNENKVLMDAISKKHDKMFSTDDLPEGDKNKYFDMGLVRAVIRQEVELFSQALMPVIHKQAKDIKHGLSIIASQGNQINALKERIEDLEHAPKPVDLSDSIKGLKSELDDMNKRFVESLVSLSDVHCELSRSIHTLDAHVNGLAVDQKIDALNKKIEEIKALPDHPDIALHGKQIAQLADILKEIKLKPAPEPVYTTNFVGPSRTIKIMTQIDPPKYQELEIRGGKIARIFNCE